MNPTDREKARLLSKKLSRHILHTLELMRVIELEQLEVHTLQEIVGQTHNFPQFVVAFHNKAVAVLKKKTDQNQLPAP